MLRVFYCSGYLIILSEDGYITVQGHQKDQINRGGEKITAEEIENLLLCHPEVIKAVLVSMLDVLIGEKSCAYIIIADTPLTAEVLRLHLHEQGRSADFKLPDRFIQIDNLPLTAVGKVDKKRLRQRLET